MQDMLAARHAVSEGVLRQAGAILARKSDEILSLAEALSLLPPMASRRVAVLADGGGHATIAADALTEAPIDAGFETYDVPDLLITDCAAIETVH